MYFIINFDYLFLMFYCMIEKIFLYKNEEKIKKVIIIIIIIIYD